jgi:hypothetical protein
MQKHEHNIASRINGNNLQPLSGVSVTVTSDDTGLPAALYSDNGVTLLTTQIITDANGYYGFFAADGKYTVTHTSARLAVPEVRKIILEDPLDNPSASLAQLAASGGAALVKTIGLGIGAVARSIRDKHRERVSVKDFGAVGDGVANDTAAINACIAFVATGVGSGVVLFPTGIYKTTSVIYVPIGVILEGTGCACGVLWNGVENRIQGSCIYGVHTGPAVVSYKGAYTAGASNISIYGDPTVTPQTGLCAGRNSGASAGRHSFKDVNITGSYSKAAIYTIASEESTYVGLRANVLGGGARFTWYISDADDLAVDSLVTNSNWQSSIIDGSNLLHQASTANSAVIYINARANTVGWAFKGGFTGMTSGTGSNHIQINMADAGASCNDFAFEDIGCEAVSNASPPISLFRISTSVGAATLKGLRIKGCSTGQFLAGTANYLLVDNNITLENADISGSNTKHPSSVENVTNSKIRLPDQDLTVRGLATSSELSGKATYFTNLASIVGTTSSRPVASRIAFSGTGANDLSISSPAGFTNTKQNVFTIAIEAATAPNTFKWSKNGGATYTTGVSITAGVAQLLADGCYITFVSGTGHPVADQWVFTVDPFINPDTGLLTWTPIDVSGAALSFTITNAQYTKVGRMVTVVADITFPVTANGSNVAIGGLPYPAFGLRTIQGQVNYKTAGTATALYGGSSTGLSSSFQLVTDNGTPVTNAAMSGALIGFSASYFSAY